MIEQIRCYSSQLFLSLTSPPSSFCFFFSSSLFHLDTNKQKKEKKNDREQKERKSYLSRQTNRSTQQKHRQRICFWLNENTLNMKKKCFLSFLQNKKKRKKKRKSTHRETTKFLFSCVRVQKG